MIILISVFLQSMSFGDNDKYTLAIGEEDKERLVLLNEIYNPFSLDFFTECEISEGDHVLEIGCGIGILSQAFSKLVGERGSVLATDVNPEPLQIAKSLFDDKIPENLHFQRLSAYDVSTLDQKYDVIYVRFLLCHLRSPEEVIRQVKTVLKPGGRFIIEDGVGNETLYSKPIVEGMEVLQFLDMMQYKLQESDDRYFASLPELLEREGFSLVLSKSAHPTLDTPRKRKILTYNVSSLKDSLLGAKKITLSQYNEMYSKVNHLAQDVSIPIYFYQFGQVCVTH